MPPKKPATTKAKAAASTAKSMVKASTGKAKTNVKATTASRTQTVKRAAVDDETDNAEDEEEDQDDAMEVDDEMAEPKAQSKKAKAQPASKVRDTDAKAAINTAPVSQRITTRAANANQHPGQQHKALDKKRRTKEEMIEVRRLAAEQKEEKEKAAKQKKAMQDKAIERVAQYEMKLADDGFNNTPLPRLRRIAGKSNLQFADRGESDEDDVSGSDQPGSDVIEDNDVVDAGLIDDNDVADAGLIDDDLDDMYLSDEVPAKALKRKGRTVKTNVDAPEDVIVLETSASKSEDRPKKKARGKRVESESEVEVVEDSGPQPPPPPPGRKNPKAKTPIRDAIKEISGTSDKNIGPDKAKSSDAPGKLKPARYVFLTPQMMLTFDETTLFYYTLSANKDGQKQSGVIRNWVDTVAKAKTISATGTVTSRASSTTLRASTTSANLRPKSRAIKREGAILDIEDIGGLSDRNETEGAEHAAAVLSPPKNGKRATSSVSNKSNLLCRAFSD
jgi:hypothetical protein